MKDTRSKGLNAEKIAAKYLEYKGFKVIFRNYLINKIAEVDLIATNENILYFIEVKYRNNNNYGDPIESVNTNKLKHLYRACDYFLFKFQNYKTYQVRLKVIGILKTAKGYEINEFDI